MRIWILMPSSFLLLVFFAMSACSIKWEDPGSQSVDQMFGGDNRFIDDMGVTRTVSTGSFSSGSPISESSSTESSSMESSSTGSSSTGSFGSRSSRNVQNEQEPVSANSNDKSQPAQSGESTTISGKWSMEFNFGSPPKATLTLFQNGEVIYGTGVIVLDPKTNLKVAAGGTVTGDKMNLDIISFGNVSLYSVSMTVIGNSASGSYTAYSPGASPISGTATGLRSPTSR